MIRMRRKEDRKRLSERSRGKRVDMPRSNVGSWSSDSSSASDLEKTHLHDGSDHEDGRKAGGEKVHHQEYVDTAFFSA